MQFSRNLARQAIELVVNENEAFLVDFFVGICQFLNDNPESLSWRGKNKPKITNRNGLEQLAKKHVDGFRRLDIPNEPTTVPDELVSFIMQAFYGYEANEVENIKITHQHSMSAEGCVGSLLERYLNSVLCQEGWCWCCGNFVKAVDFIKKDSSGRWLAIQIKNRDNSENSASKSVRDGTDIRKWFRSFSRTGKTNWKNLPELMQGYDLSEEGFKEFIREYLAGHKS